MRWLILIVLAGGLPAAAADGLVVQAHIDAATLDGEAGRIAFTVVEAPPGGAVQARQEIVARVDIEDFTAFWQRTAGQTVWVRLEHVGARWDILGVVEPAGAPPPPPTAAPRDGSSSTAPPRAPPADDEAALRARLIERLATAMGRQPPEVATRPDPELALLDEELRALAAIPGPEALARRATLQAERDRLVAAQAASGPAEPAFDARLRETLADLDGETLDPAARRALADLRHLSGLGAGDAVVLLEALRKVRERLDADQPPASTSRPADRLRFLDDEIETLKRLERSLAGRRQALEAEAARLRAEKPAGGGG